MPSSILCSQCGAPAERCDQCAGALCGQRLCAELHQAACAGLAALPTPGVRPTRGPAASGRRPQPESAETLQLAHELARRIDQHRQAGRAALLVDQLEQAFDELLAARDLEPCLDRLGPRAQRELPSDWETETDLVPLARALAARHHPRAVPAWVRVLDDRPARSIQAEAAAYLAQAAFAADQPRRGLRALHAASSLGRGVEPHAFVEGYRAAGLEPAAAFRLYLAAVRLEPHSARAADLRDPLTGQVWPDQDPRWWPTDATETADGESDHRLEALHRARDLAHTKRDLGWLLLAEGDYLAGPLGVRALGRGVRTGAAEAADHDAFVRIRIAYEGAADRLPDVAWPWYRLAELLAWSGFAERAQEHLVQAERRSLGQRDADKQRGRLRALVLAGLGCEVSHELHGPRPFPPEPFSPQLAWRLSRLARLNP